MHNIEFSCDMAGLCCFEISEIVNSKFYTDFRDISVEFEMPRGEVIMCKLGPNNLEYNKKQKILTAVKL